MANKLTSIVWVKRNAISQRSSALSPAGVSIDNNNSYVSLHSPQSVGGPIPVQILWSHSLITSWYPSKHLPAFVDVSQNRFFQTPTLCARSERKCITGVQLMGEGIALVEMTWEEKGKVRRGQRGTQKLITFFTSVLLLHRLQHPKTICKLWVVDCGPLSSAFIKNVTVPCKASGLQA